MPNIFLKPAVSVIVPVYRVDKYLTECLESIVNQTLTNIEIIIVDEGDDDRCRKIIDYYQSIDCRIVAPHKKNGGYGASCNLGISMAKGEFIAIVESDDVLAPNMYEELYDLAIETGADVVKGPYYEYFSNGTLRDCSYRRKLKTSVPQKKCFSAVDYGEILEIHASLWAAIYRTSYMREKNIRFIQAKGGAYVDVGFRIDTLTNTNKIVWYDKPFYLYRVDAEGSTTNNFRLAPMIKRWSEVHQAHKDQQFNEYFYPFLIKDEYLNTIGWLKNIKCSEEEIREISTNLQKLPIETIKKSPVLTGNQKNEIFACRKDPEGFLIKMNRYRRLKRAYADFDKFINFFGSQSVRYSFFCLAVIFLLASLNISEEGGFITSLTEIILGLVFIFSLCARVVQKLLSRAKEKIVNVYFQN